MSTMPSHVIQTGWYTDYSRTWGWQTQWLCSQSFATIWTNLLGIVVTIALGRLFRLSLKVFEPPPIHGSTHEVKRGPTAPEAIGFYLLTETIQERREGRVRLNGNTASSIRQKKEPLWRTIIKIASFLITFVGFLICGVVTALLATDSKALSSNSDCGVYVLASNSSQSQDSLDSFAFQAQLDSAQLAQSCYHTTSQADGCNFFTQQKIPYTTSDGPCPFAEGMCHENMSSASQFSTGPTDATALGIHAPRTFQFQRNTTCVPLNDNKTYISTTEKDGIFTHTYYYGSKNDIPFTWQAKTYDSNLDLQGHYLLDTVVSGSYYIPIPSLIPPNGSSLTLMFIHAQKIAYLAPSDDPVFPANYKFYYNFTDEPRWWNSRAHASVLACVDTTLWRDPMSSTNWKLYPPERAEPSFVIENAHVRGGFLLMGYSLLWSNVYNTINYRLGGGLAAQKLVRGRESLPLAKEQWKAEAKQLFEASLARIQIDARNIAQGTAASYSGLQKLEVDPALCDKTFSFMSQGWQNVNLTGSIWIAVVAFICVVLAIPLPNDRLFVQMVWGFFTTIVLRKAPGYYRKIFEAIQWLLEKGSTAWNSLKRRWSRRN